MRRSFTTVLLSASVLTSVVSPSSSQDLNPNPSQGGRLAVRVVAGDFRAPGDFSVLDKEPFPVAQGQPRPEAPPLPAPHPDDPPQWLGDDGPGGPDRGWPPPMGGPDPSGLGFAARLAAAETYVGITAGQLDAWRAYTSALIDFLENAGPGPRPDREPRPAPAGADGTAKPSPDADPFFAERLADRAIAQAEKAKALKQAIDALRPVLRPEQLERLVKTEPAFPPPPPAPGPGGENVPPPAEED